MAAVLRPKEIGLEEVAPKIARRREEARRQLPADILLTLATGGIGGAARVTAQQASREIVRQALGKLAPTIGRKAALKQARTALRGVAVVPREYLKPFRGITYKDFPVGKRGQYTEFARTARPQEIMGREVWLGASAPPSASTIPHEMMVHYPHYVPQSAKLERLLMPLKQEGITAARAGKSPAYGSLIERHAREATRRIMRKAFKAKGAPRRLTKGQTDTIFEESLKDVLRTGGWAP